MICPQCQNDVPVTETQYLSMYTCPKCQAVYFIDINGQADFGDMSGSEESFQQDQLSPHQDFSNLNPFESSPNQSNEPNQLGESAPFNEFSEVVPAAAEEQPIADLSPFGVVASEIVDFANQNEDMGVLTYDLTVTGLDTKETVSVFREAVEDSKFGWLPQDIVIKNGECEFKNLNPVQAFVIAKRIQFLDIEMQWRQNVQV